MLDRVIGIENEYATILGSDLESSGGDKKFRPHEGIFDQNLRLALKRIPRSYFEEPRAWLENGGCIYVDTGEHPEYASPECRRLRDLLRYERAGERLITENFSIRHDATPNDHGDNEIRTYIFKNNLGTSSDGLCMGMGEKMGVGGKTHFPLCYGCHENYLLRYCKSSEEKILERIKPKAMDGNQKNTLLPFLITRQILDGAGWWEKNSYVISQRALVTIDSVGIDSVQNRPILHIKNEAHVADADLLDRLHIICGDANMLDTALFLKFGTTLLILNVIEKGEWQSELKIRNPVRSMKAVAFNGGNDRVIKMSDGAKMSAVEVQEIYYRAVKKYLSGTSFESDAVRDEAFEIIDLWHQALNAIAEDDTEWMLGRLDYATKYYLTRNEKDPLRRKTIDLLYHGLTYNKLRERILKCWARRRIVTEEEIKDAMINPPQDTRAKMRGEFVKKLITGKSGNKYRARIKWDAVELQPNILPYDKSRQVKLSDPLVFEDDNFRQLMANWPEQEPLLNILDSN